MNPTPPSPLAAAQDQARQLLDAGIAASQANDADKALDCFRAASAAHPAWALPHFLAGSEHAAAGRMAEAEAAFANAVLLEPGLRLARYQLGLLQFSSGRAAVALLTWQALLELGDGVALAHYVRGFAALARDDGAQALASFEAGLALPQDNPAVAADIRLVLARLAEVQAPGQAQPELEPSEGTHVLLANYGNPGRLH
ncbi:MAG TPA: hypothetical protein VLJ58_19725 [Ramlibacter sp.]|nr:hypothetical protein [Ramlibacter sp.]